VIDTAAVDGQEGRQTPRTAGQDRVHYAPLTAAQMLSRRELEESRPPAGLRVGFLGFRPLSFDVALDLRLPNDVATAARGLYSALHRLDQAGRGLLRSEAPPVTPEWAGVRDRLLRATAHSRGDPATTEGPLG